MKTRGSLTISAVLAALLVQSISAVAQFPLSRFTANQFVADGEIGEFINDGGDSQSYFVTNPADPDFGAIRTNTQIAPGVILQLDTFPTDAGAAGFGDLPAAFDPQLISRAPTGFNVGRVFVSYNPAVSGVSGTFDAYFFAMDVSAPAPLDTLLGTAPVAFDVDGDGSVIDTSDADTLVGPGVCPPEFNEIPTQGDDIYRVILDLDSNGIPDARLQVVETTAPAPANSVVLMASLPGVVRYVSLEPLNSGAFTLPELIAFTNYHLDVDGDNLADPASVVGVGADVELMLTNVSSAAPGLAGRDPFETRNGTNPCCATFRFFVDSNDDECIGGGAEDAVTVVANFPCPDIEVRKEVKCATEPDSAFRDTAQALPGSQVEFRLSVTNFGNRDLTALLTDQLTCNLPATAVYVPGSCTTNPPLPGVCNAIEAAFSDGFIVDAGTVTGNADCDVNIPGGSFEIRFRVELAPGGTDPAFCNVTAECENAITVEGTSTVAENPVPDDQEQPPGVDDEYFVTVSDVAKVVDTTREVNAGADDNVVTMDIICRGATLDKQVELFATSGSPSKTVPPGDDISLPALEPGDFPITIRYSYIVTNTGDVTETIEINDPDLCDDITSTPGVSTVPGQCALCQGFPSGTISINVAPGATQTVFCQVRFDNQAALDAFLLTDDDGDAECYTNIATGTADALIGPGDQICDSAPAIDLGQHQARFCTRSCELMVTKYVRCLDECGGGVTGPDEDTLLKVVPGACVEFVVDIENTSSVATTNICDLRITDTLAGGGACVSFVPGSVVFEAVDPGNTVFACGNVPAGFNVTGTPFVYDVQSCAATPAGLPPGWKLRFRYTAQVAPGANPTSCSISNTAQAEGSIDCGTSPPVYICLDNDNVSLDVLNCKLICSKDYTRFAWDQNFNCVTDDPYVNFTNTLTNLLDKTFPVIVELTVTATNDDSFPNPSECTLGNLQALDPQLFADVNATPGVEFVDMGGNPTPLTMFTFDKATIAPGETATARCYILFATAAAARDFAETDGDLDPTPGDRIYLNRVEVRATPVSTGDDICVPANADELSTTCDEEIAFPPPCDVEVTKQVRCPSQPGAVCMDDIVAAPGATLTFCIEITNTGPVNIPRLCLFDSLDPNCRSWIVPGTVAAELQRAGGGAMFDLSGCLAGLTNAIATNQQLCVVLADCGPLGGNPVLAPNDKLTIEFDVLVPPDYTSGVLNPDCVNEITVQAFAEACEPGEVCGQDTADASIDVAAPNLTCEKVVSAKVSGIGPADPVDYGPAASINIDMPEFPVRLIYSYTVTNDGELPINNVCIDDSFLIGHVPAGVTIENCAIDPGDQCAGPGTSSVNVGTLNPGDSVTITCELVISDFEQWALLADSDGGDEDCFINRASASGEADASGVCGNNAMVPVDSACSAEVCIAQLVCPPVTCVRIELWNQNEVPFTGIPCFCVNSWYNGYLSEVSPFFTAAELGTTRGKARLDAVADTACDDEPVTAPMLGTAAQVVEYPGGRIDKGGVALIGVGAQIENPGKIIYGTTDPGGESRAKPYNLIGDPDGEQDAGGDPHSRTPIVPQDADDIPVATTGIRGSVLAFPYVEVKLNNQGDVIADTLLSLTNATLRDNVRVLLIYGNGDPAMCNALHTEIPLTVMQPGLIEASTGTPGGGLPPVSVPPFRLLDQDGVADPDPLNPGGRVIKGWVLAIALDELGREINWNYLTGKATMVNYAQQQAWEYLPWSFQALEGEPGTVLSQQGKVVADGVKYVYAPDKLLLSFFAPGEFTTSTDWPNTASNNTLLRLDTELTLWVFYKDFTDGSVPPIGKRPAGGGLDWTPADGGGLGERPLAPAPVQLTND